MPAGILYTWADPKGFKTLKKYFLWPSAERINLIFLYLYSNFSLVSEKFEYKYKKIYLAAGRLKSGVRF